MCVEVFRKVQVYLHSNHIKKQVSTYLHFLDQEIRTIREQMHASMVVLVAFYTNNWHDFWSRTVTREAVTFFQSQKGGGI